jgi:hypothetical protein
MVTVTGCDPNTRVATAARTAIRKSVLGKLI